SGACPDEAFRRGRYHGRMFSNIPPVTKALLVANGVAFLLPLLVGNPACYGFMLWPLVDAGPFSQIPQSMPWQLVTYSCLHGSCPHVSFNMLAMLMFGAPLEYTWGNRRFLTYYFACVAGAGLCQLVVASWAAHQGGMPYPTVGAS